MLIDNGGPNKISSALRRGKWRGIIIKGRIGPHSGICRISGLDFGLVSFVRDACKRKIFSKTLLYLLPKGPRGPF